jgi:hypothetical protein
MFIGFAQKFCWRNPIQPYGGVLEMGDPQSQKGLSYTKSLSAHDLDDVPPRPRKPLPSGYLT